MTVFLSLVSIGLLAMIYILYCVTRESWRSGHSKEFLEKIPPNAPVSIAQFSIQRSRFRKERSA